MKEVLEKITFGGQPLTLLGETIKVGDKAPDFTVVDKDLKPVKLSDFNGKKLVLAVYPSVDTEVCQIQNKKFNNEITNFRDVMVLSISCDLPFAQSRFCATEGLINITTVSDHKDVDFGTKYGFLIKELRLLTRGTVIIDSDGIVQYVEICPEVTDEPDYVAAVEKLRELK